MLPVILLGAQQRASMSSDQKQKGDVTMGFWLLFLAAIVGGPALLAGQASGRCLSTVAEGLSVSGWTRLNRYMLGPSRRRLCSIERH